MPALSVYPVPRLTTLEVSSMLSVGVNVAVQVMPPSVLATLESLPLAMLRSSLSKPVTASLKVMVTREVSPALRAVSAKTMEAVGALVSTV